VAHLGSRGNFALDFLQVRDDAWHVLSLPFYKNNCHTTIMSVQETVMYKIHALKEVRIYADVVDYDLERLGEGYYRKRTINTRKYVIMQKGETRSDVSILFGIDPRYLPGKAAYQIYGFEFVPYKDEHDSPDFQALVRVEEMAA
jgi:hypothetical protein